MKRVSVQGSTGGFYEFMFDEDRKEVNKKEGWSDKKNKYLLDRPRVEEFKIKADTKRMKIY